METKEIFAAKIVSKAMAHQRSQPPHRENWTWGLLSSSSSSLLWRQAKRTPSEILAQAHPVSAARGTCFATLHCNLLLSHFRLPSSGIHHQAEGPRQAQAALVHARTDMDVTRGCRCGTCAFLHRLCSSSKINPQLKKNARRLSMDATSCTAAEV